MSASKKQRGQKKEAGAHGLQDTPFAQPEIQEIIHELQVYKIELEMQNEELRFAQSELEASRNKYLSLFESAPVGFMILDRNGVILQANEKSAVLLGLEMASLEGKRFQQFVQADFLHEFYVFFNALQGASKKVSELRLAGTGKYVRADGYFFHDSVLNAQVCQLALMDVTLSKEQDEQLASQKFSQQKAIVTTVLQTQEEERSRIAEALHSGLGQLLYAAKFKLEDISGNEEVKENIQRFLDDAIREARNLSFILMPTLLKDFGLKTMLEETAKRFSSDTFRLDCVVTGLTKRLPANREVAIFRIIQELLNNILKHAGASKASIRVKHQKQRLTIIVKDNGKGFHPESAATAKKGTGLRTVGSRLELLGGQMHIDSTCGKGSTITISL